MLVRLLSALGWLIARTPEPILEAATGLLGEAAYLLLPRRRRLLRSNLQHAFPGRPAAWYRELGRISTRRTIETGLLALASPHFSKERIRTMATLAPETAELVAGLAARPRPLVVGTMHVALWESLTWMRLLSPPDLPPVGVIFRPLDHAAADAYVRSTRERFGMQLLSRREGFARARDILRARGIVALLFDQNAGERGCLTLLFQRVCSTTELPGLLAETSGAEVQMMFPRRVAFWRARIETAPVPHSGGSAGITLALNRSLEARLSDDEGLRSNWLWGHDRWRHQDIPGRRFRLASKRDLLARDCAERGWEKLPRVTRFWIRLPNWLGDVVMAAPLLRALRDSRPDAEITAVGRPAFAPLVKSWAFVDAFMPLPPRGSGYFRAFLRRRTDGPDVWLALTNSVRGDLEGLLAGAPQRFGLVRPGKPRPLLTHRFAAGPFSPHIHQVEEWEACFRHFGLAAPVSRLPLEATEPVPAGPIGLITGSENNPQKRWPVAAWRELIAALPGEAFLLFGTAGDRALTAEVAAGFPAGTVADLAGRTDLAEYMARLRSCRCVICNDTGGMHLANALGIPVVALYGPTNPLRTGPAFAAPRAIVQPPGCPAAGGVSLRSLPLQSVLTAFRALGETGPNS